MPLKVAMRPVEVALFSALLSRSQSYFEYGIGGSTFLASQLVQGPIHGIDSSVEWIDNVRAEVGDNPDVTLRHVDIGEIGEWGRPVSREAEDRFPDYSRAIHQAEVDKIDFCLVDGRFRVACFLEALRTLDSDAILALHDYSSRRRYHVVERFARPIAQARDLAVFVRRRDCDMAALDRILESRRLDWA